MNNNERILHILDQSTCLTRRQMKDYLAGNMLPEEVHAAEMHISSCPLCSMALDGFEAHSEEALEAIASLNSGFLKDHFDAITPKIHLNSLAPAATFDSRTRKKKKSISLLQVTGIAAALLVGFGTLWFMDHRNHANETNAIAVKTEASKTPTTDVVPPVHTEREEMMHKATTDKSATGNAIVAEKPIAKKDPEPTSDLEAQPVIGSAAPPAAAASEQNIAAAPVMKAVPRMKEKAADERAAKDTTFNTRAFNTSSRNEYAASDGYSRTESKDAYKPTGLKMSAAAAPGKSDDAKAMSANEDHLQKGDDLLSQNKYGAALTHYNKELNSADRGHHAQAAIGAAQCYAKLGNKRKAISLLQEVIDQESGQQRRRAKRLLRELESE